jgi:hypothetical protein
LHPTKRAAAAATGIMNLFIIFKTSYFNKLTPPTFMQSAFSTMQVITLVSGGWAEGFKAPQASESRGSFGLFSSERIAQTVQNLNVLAVLKENCTKTGGK